MIFFKSKFITRGLLAATFSLIATAQAELPSFPKAPWLGYFAYGKDDKMLIKISSEGDISSHPLGKDGEQKAYLKVPFEILLRETLPNGRTRNIPFDPKGLQSESELTDDLREMTITGEFGEGAKFEVTIHFKRDILTLGGRITETGSQKHPLSFHLRSRHHHYHGDLLRRLDGDQKEFDKIVGLDWLELHHIDKNKEKLQLTDLVGRSTDESRNGPGSSKVEIQANIIDKKKRLLILETKGNSLLNLITKRDGPLHQGYFIEWSPNQEKDPKNEARLVFHIEKT